MPVRNLVVIVVSLAVSIACYARTAPNRYANVLASAMGVISRNFIEPVDDRTLFDAAMNGMVSDLDEYSNYIDPRSYQRFQQSIEQEFVGVGIEVVGPPQVPKITIVNPVFGSPAFQVGIRAGDVIIGVNGTNVEGLTMDQVIDRIKGPRGSEVTLEVLHHGSDTPVVLTMHRETIHTESVMGDTRRADGSWNFTLACNPRIGYVRVRTFGELTVEELRPALQSVRGRDALILDLRGNAGGLLGAAVATCDMFLNEGTIVSIRGRRRSDDEVFTARPETTIVDPQLPLVVLVDRFSASASEIVSACLQDQRRAVIVGERTWGKGTVQNVIPLEGGRSALKLTTASYWRPSGRNIHRRPKDGEDVEWGVRPDPRWEVKLTDEQYTRLAEQRRERDLEIAGPGSSAAAAPPPAGAAPSGTEPLADQQLEKAIEYLQDSGPPTHSDAEPSTGLRPAAAASPRD